MINIENLWHFVESRAYCNERTCTKCSQIHGVPVCPVNSFAIKDELIELANLLKQYIDKGHPEITEELFLELLEKEND